jgi:hypothetical protein
MNEGELEHPPPAPWNLNSCPEEMIIDSNDSPEDECDCIARRNGVRHREQRSHRGT